MLLLKGKDIADAVRAAREMSDDYRALVLAGDDPTKSIDDMIWVVRNGLVGGKGMSLLLSPISGNASTVLGGTITYESGYEIFIMDGLDEPWRRFVTAKELFHVVLDDPRFRSIDIAKHLDELEISFGVEEHEADSQSPECEYLAEIAAMEFLFPFANRASLVAAGNGGLDMRTTARTYGIPQVLAEQYCSPVVIKVLSDIESQI